MAIIKIFFIVRSSKFVINLIGLSLMKTENFEFYSIIFCFYSRFIDDVTKSSNEEKQRIIQEKISEESNAFTNYVDLLMMR